MKFAILAPGKIAHSMARAVSEIEKIDRKSTRLNSSHP